MITDIRLQNYRSYKDSAFELSDGVNIIVGPNASGKTNLLEAVLLLSQGKTYRSNKPELIKFGQPWARIDAHTKSGGQRTIKITELAKEFSIDGVKTSRLSREKSIPVVLFEPEHLLMLSGRPDLRRDYLDGLIEQTTAGYGKTRSDYKRALYQRNNLLKKGAQSSNNQIFAWSVRLSELGGQIASARKKIATALQKDVGNLYKQLSKSTAVASLGYLSPLPIGSYSSSMLKKLESSQDLDYARGFTTVGPHREDLSIAIDGRHSDTVSRGETRTMLLALKILELQILTELSSSRPILLLDDVFSELDGARRKSLTNYLRNYQTFITTTDADVVVKSFATKSNVILIKN